MLGAVTRLYGMNYAEGMKLEDDQFLQSAIYDFARAQRTRWLQVAVLCLLIFPIGVAVGMSINYEIVEINVEIPAGNTSLNLSTAKTTRT